MPKVSIGLAVYNGEKFLCNALDSLLSQTFSDFELILSDNASTDSTQMICEKYAKNDKRIRYFRQKNNIGMFSNVMFVLEQAVCDYFQWAAVDDLWHPKFLEKNIHILESDDALIGSISNVGEYGEFTSDWQSIVKNISPSNLKSLNVTSIHGPYFKKVAAYLKLRQASANYAVHRTDKLRSSISHIKGRYLWDFEIPLSVIKFGDLNVCDEVLMYKYTKGETGNQTPLEYQMSLNLHFYEILFPHLLFVIRCMKQFGIIVSLRNFHLILRYFAQGESQLFLDVLHIIKRKIWSRFIE